MEVEKRSFSQADLIGFAKEFSDTQDYGIDPLGFINSFVNSGIIHFVNDKAELSLPFIKSYVLASELVSNLETAKRYFYSGPEIDLNTFDLCRTRCFTSNRRTRH